LNIFKTITVVCILISAYALYTNGLLIRLFGEEGVIVIDKYANELYEKLPDDKKILPLPQAPKTMKLPAHSRTLGELETRVARLEDTSYMMTAIVQVIVPLFVPAIMYRFKGRKYLDKSKEKA